MDTVKHAREQHLSLRVFVGQVGGRRVHLRPLRGLGRPARGGSGVAGAHHEPRRAVRPARRRSPGSRRCPQLDLADPTGHDLEPEAKIELARRAEAAALAADPRIKNSEGGDFSDRRARYAYATSHGFGGEYETSSFSLSVSPVATQNGEMQRDGWYHVTRKRARLDVPEEIGRIAAQRALRRLGARRVKTAEVPVVFDPDMAASLSATLRARPPAPSLYRGASFLVGKLGQAIASPSVTIVDDGTIPGGLGSRPFDGEGLPVRRTVLVDQRRARLLPARHLQRQEARHAVDASRRARRQRVSAWPRPICTSPPARPIPAS